MQKIQQRKRNVISKQMARAIQKAEAEIIREGDRQLDIQVCAAMLALSRYWMWSKEELKKLVDIQREAWKEVGKDNDLSMLQLLDQECDIELTNCEGVSYREFKYLNTEIDDGEDLSPQEWLILRIKQKSWMECLIMGSIFVALYRKEGWSPRRIKELMDHMQQIKADYDYQPKKLVAAVLNECKFDWLDYRGKLVEE